MTTPFATRVAALGVALLVNTMMIGAVAYLFNGQLHRRPTATVLVPTATHHASSVKAWAPTL
jgi:hypothetical protein